MPWDLNAFVKKKAILYVKTNAFVLVFYFHYSFFVGDDAYSFGVNVVPAQVYLMALSTVGFVYDYAKSPAHVKRLKHLLVSYSVAEFSGGFLD